MNSPESIEHYIEIGAVTLQGVDEDGEFIFAVSEKAKEVAPKLWEIHTAYVDDMLIQLYEKDLISIEYNENLEAIITLSDEGRKIAKEMGLVPLDDN